MTSSAHLQEEIDMSQPQQRDGRICLGPATLEDGELQGLETEAGRLVCLAKVGGAYRAIDDWCNHAGCSLSAGWIERQGTRHLVVCPCHEIGFDLETGENVTAKHIADDQEAFSVEVVDGQVWIQPLGGGER